MSRVEPWQKLGSSASCPASIRFRSATSASKPPVGRGKRAQLDFLAFKSLACWLLCSDTDMKLVHSFCNFFSSGDSFLPLYMTCAPWRASVPRLPKHAPVLFEHSLLYNRVFPYSIPKVYSEIRRTMDNFRRPISTPTCSSSALRGEAVQALRGLFIWRRAFSQKSRSRQWIESG